jgi:hypothetical protein
MLIRRNGVAGGVLGLSLCRLFGVAGAHKSPITKLRAKALIRSSSSFSIFILFY